MKTDLNGEQVITPFYSLIVNQMKDLNKTAIECFQSGDPQVIRCLQARLQDLLSGSKTDYTCFGEPKEYEHLRLHSFEDYFDWDEDYSVWITYTYSGCSVGLYECDDREEALAIAAGVTDPYLEVESPEEIDVVEEVRKFRVEVSNLRLKHS